MTAKTSSQIITTQERLKSMTTEKALKRVIALAAFLVASVAGATSSPPTHIYVDPSGYHLWHTVTGATMRLEWNTPPSAGYADLLVTGDKFSFEKKKIATGWTDVTLPAPTGSSDEDVYRFNLTFNDGTQLTTVLGRVCGVSSGGSEMTPTRCMMSTNINPWCRSQRRYVMTVPAGTEELTLDGAEVVTGLGGDAGYYAAGPFAGGSWHHFTVRSAVDPYLTDEKDIYSCSVGMSLIVR